MLPLLPLLIRLFFVSSGGPLLDPLAVFPYKEVAGQPAALLGPDLPRAGIQTSKAKGVKSYRSD